MATLTEQLGFSADQRVLIITADDLGFSYAANVGTYQSIREGIASSASLMVPAPWSRGAAADYRGEDVGVHLTLNSELDLYRWGPITHAPSLLDGEGGFPRTVDDVWEHADIDEVRREWRAQLERAIYWGFDVSHLDSHLDGVELKPEFFDVYIDLAEEFHLPVRIPPRKDEPRIGFPFRMLVEERGILAPDYVVSLAAIGFDEQAMRRAFSELPAGVTEVCVHPSLDTPEVRAADPDWESRVKEHELLVKNGVVASMINDLQLPVVGYRALRQLMRNS